MNITSIKTKKIVVGDTLEKIINTYVTAVDEGDILVITSKIVSICEGRVVKNDGTVDKQKLIEQEADYYFGNNLTKRYGITLTIKLEPVSTLIASAGIDESNGNGYFILWPKDPFGTADTLWQTLKKKFKLKNLGILIVDSNIVPLRWGTRGLAIAWCGFEELKNYIGTADLFGRKLRVTKQNIADDLASAANLVMGEGAEQTPLAVISDVPNLTFFSRPPTNEEIDSMKISIQDDIYAPLLEGVRWKKGGTQG
ncbi:coenzyme F420-0:L-glutamate ligase [Candidatus Gottesmanbacteria bacterium]|nr:coenzyme F420-0:L-glutamate ligase [Candidatus Gottesmanbacteria bacterium]